MLDAGIFGFPSASAAGLRALALLHAHDVGVAVNTARPLGQVQAYCRAYGFVGGVAEYGAVAWDAVAGRERGLVGAEALAQVARVRTALRQVPGVFQHDDYRSSIRAYTYEGGRTVALPTLMIRAVLAGVGADRLALLQTPVETAIVAKEVDKGRGLVALLALAGQCDLETIAIGDAEADLPMFRVATRSFAPAQIPCRAVARALGCRIAGRAFQGGLLESVRALLHPGGGRCARCRAGERVGAEADPLVWELLEATDWGRPRRLLQALLDPMCLQAFAQ